MGDFMKIEILKECGYEEAVKGLGFSYGITDFKRLESVAEKLAYKDGGHNKFLESIVVWIEITAARYWWQEFDTYRVGTTKQSESTMHTITKNPLTQHDFEYQVSTNQIDYLNQLIEHYKVSDGTHKQQLFYLIKANLPEGYLQTRMVCTNYKVLANIISQRKNHMLEEWHQFIFEIINQLKYGYLIERHALNGRL